MIPSSCAHRRLAFCAGVALLMPPAVATAQQSTPLPAITVTSSRLAPAPVAQSVTAGASRARPSEAASPVAEPAAQPAPFASSAGAGTFTTVITAEEIADSPAATVQEIIAQAPGVQLVSLGAAANGAQSMIDLRGFGAFSSANTLILINGRRLNDLDLAGVDLSTLPRDAIARIEITRGNSGAVLYGDNAVGGVINIVTKTGLGGPPATFRGEAGMGSYGLRQGAVSTTAASGPWLSSAFANTVRADGYRANNAVAQHNAVGEIRYMTADFSAFLNISGDDQRLGLPGGRLVDPSTGVNELVSNRRGATTPYDFAAKQGANATAGFTTTLWNGGELIVDGGVRDKTQQGGFFGSLPLSPFAARFVDSDLTTWSITPRLRVTNPVLGLPSSILTGLDYYDATYASSRGQYSGTLPIHVYNLAQKSLGGYWQHTLGVAPSTDVSYGARVQRMWLDARDRVNAAAPGNFGEVAAIPLSTSEIQHALHVGIDHRLTGTLTLFARAARAFRTPNVDERLSSGPAFDEFFNPIAGTFALKTQTSHDVEGGLRLNAGSLAAQASLYDMELDNEIHFNPALFYNVNLDPTRRYGGEASASYRFSDSLAFRAGGAYTRAVFREGPFAGRDVPLVSRYTASAGFSWNIWSRYLVLDGTLRGWSSRYMDNDQANRQAVIPAAATLDLKLSGEIDRFFWSLSVLNLFDAAYYDYAVASTFTPGRFNAYPLPGRTYLAKAGVAF